MSIFKVDMIDSKEIKLNPNPTSKVRNINGQGSVKCQSMHAEMCDGNSFPKLGVSHSYSEILSNLLHNL